MKFLMAALAALAGIAAATPLQAVAVYDPIVPYVEKDNCESQDNYSDRTDSHSPLVEDCRTLMKNIDQGGSWAIQCKHNEPYQMQTFAKLGTCAIGAHCEDKEALSRINYIGNNDTIEVINHSIESFAKDGKIGASGFFKCKNNLNPVTGPHEMFWAIYPIASKP